MTELLLGCGIDIEETSRFEKYLGLNEPLTEPLIADLFTPREAEHNRRLPLLQSYTAGFACKEAVIKAFTGIRPGHGIDWKEVELIFGEQAPADHRVVLNGSALALYQECGADSIRSAVCIEDDFAMVEVIILSNV